MELINRLELLQKLESHADNHSVFHKMRAEVKLVFTLILLIFLVSIPNGNFVLFGAVFILEVILLVLALVPGSILFSRITTILPIVLLFSASNLLHGDWILFFSVAAKSVLCVMAVTLLVATTPLDTLIETLIRWRISEIFVLQFSVLLRYLTTFMREAASMHQSYVLRCGKNRWIEMQDVPSFMGSLILRSLTKGEEVYLAMKCRGGFEHKADMNMEQVGAGTVHVRDLSLRYKEKTVFDRLNLEIAEGEKVAIIGPNGVGKTTFVHALVGIGATVSGDISVNGVSMNQENLAEIRRMCGFLFQNPDNQVFNARVYEDICFAAKKVGLPDDEIERKAMQLLDHFQIADLKDRYCHSLSGGEKRMVALAGILMTDPQIMIMDEPSVFLDPKSRRSLIKELQANALTQIIVTHDLDLALDVCDRVILLAEGEVVADGKSNDILCDEVLLTRYDLELPLKLQGMATSM